MHLESFLVTWNANEQAPQRNTLDTGTLGHELILEPEHFSSRYFRVPLAKEYPNALTTIKQLQDTLKDAGLKITGTKPELVERVLKSNYLTPLYLMS